MLVTEEEYIAQAKIIEQAYIDLAEELIQQMFNCMDWDHKTKEVDARIAIAIWLKKNEIHCMEE